MYAYQSRLDRVGFSRDTCRSRSVVVAAPGSTAPPSTMASQEESKAAQMAVELKRNRELTTKLYVLRGDALPNDHR